MGRAKAVQQADHPYNLGARCINREWFNIPMEEVWEIFADELNQTTKKHGWLVHLFVLMSNHYHLMASTPAANISECMHYFGTRTSKRLTRSGNRINETYAGRHFKCILQDPGYFRCVYKYNYRNPIAAGICDHVEIYPFSTLPQVMGLAPPRLLLAEDATFTSDPMGTLTWLNTKPMKESVDLVKCALKHQYFTSKLCRTLKRPIISEGFKF